MALGPNMKRKTLIPTNIEELNRHQQADQVVSETVFNNENETVNQYTKESLPEITTEHSESEVIVDEGNFQIITNNTDEFIHYKAIESYVTETISNAEKESVISLATESLSETTPESKESLNVLEEMGIPVITNQFEETIQFEVTEPEVAKTFFDAEKEKNNLSSSESFQEITTEIKESLTSVQEKPTQETNVNSAVSNKAFTETNGEVLIEFKPSLRTKVNKINVYISGKLNIYNANFIKQNIMNHCSKYGTVEIIAKGVEELDLTFVQFGYYYTAFKNRNEQLATFDIEKPSVQILNLLDVNGYTDLLIRKKLA
jgi:hypothetical protein